MKRGYRKREREREREGRELRVGQNENGCTYECEYKDGDPTYKSTIKKMASITS